MPNINFLITEKIISENEATIYIDLEKNLIFNTITINKKNGEKIGKTEKIKSADVYISDDNENYILILPEKNEASDVSMEIKVDNLTTRYIKLVIEGVKACSITIENRKSDIKLKKITETGIELTPPFSKENFYLYLAIGQSNMAGRAAFSDEDFEIIPNTYLFNPNEKWEALECGMLRGEMQGYNRYSSVETDNKINRLAPTNVFAREMKKNHPDKAIGIISNAIGGTSIASWQKNSAETNYYTEAVRRAREAMKTGTLKGVIWHQGESDQNKTEIYLEEFAKIVDDLRNDLEIPELPVIIGQILLSKSREFNDELMRIKAVIPYTDCVSAEGTSDLGDGTHFDSQSQRILGFRYAEKMKDMDM